jgi:hypothetical protein
MSWFLLVIFEIDKTCQPFFLLQSNAFFSSFDVFGRISKTLVFV